MLETYNLWGFFIGIHNHETALSLRRDWGLEVQLNTVRTLKIATNAFQMMRRSHTLEDRGRILVFVCEMSDMGLCV